MRSFSLNCSHFYLLAALVRVQLLPNSLKTALWRKEKIKAHQWGNQNKASISSALIFTIFGNR